MAPRANTVKVWKYVQSLTIETKNFAFEAKVILGLEITCQDGKGAKIGFNGSHHQ